MADRNTPMILPVITAGALMDKHFAPRATVVDGLLTAGTYILAGPPKIGKSFLAMQLCYCVATGTAFLEHNCRKATVLYLALEDTEARLQDRLMHMFGAEWEGENLFFSSVLPGRGAAAVEMLNGFVFDHPETRLIIIDTLQRVRAGDASNCSYAGDYEDILPFKEFADTRDLALLLIHHTRKNTEGENVFDQISGTNGLLGASDGAYVLHGTRAGTELDFVGRDLPSQRYILAFSSEDCQWRMLRAEQGDPMKKPEPLLDVVDSLIQDRWSGKPSDFFDMVVETGYREMSQPNVLVRKLNQLTVRLRDEKNIEYSTSRRSSSRQLKFRRLPLPDDDGMAGE